VVLIESFLNRCWYGHGFGCLVVRWLLIPFSLLFRLLVAVRALAYRRGWRHSLRLPVPVVVVGNITAGGAGKTPLTLALVAWLQEAGYRPGIVSRGYGGSARQAMPVMPDSSPDVVGDEPVLLARRAGCPVWIGRKRAEVGRQLLAFHPEVDVLVADDGLQHYALARDVEIVVVDGRRGFGNGWLMPAGPLREPVGRLKRAAAVVVNGDGQVEPGVARVLFRMQLQGSRFRNLSDPARTASATELAGRPIHAVAGIGNPQRFFEHLGEEGLEIIPLAFPDHHVYEPNDLPAGRVVVTEKDAVKIAPLAQELDLQDYWMLAVDAELEPGLKGLMLSLLNKDQGHHHGPQTA
jgi:tetraacyldisaccharide 4'-kinase